MLHHELSLPVPVLVVEDEPLMQNRLKEILETINVVPLIRPLNSVL